LKIAGKGLLPAVRHSRALSWTLPIRNQALFIVPSVSLVTMY